MIELVRYIMERRSTAVLMTAVFALYPLTDWISAVLIALVCLRRGFRDGLLMFLVATSVAGLMNMWSGKGLVLSFGPIALELGVVFAGAYVLHLTRTLSLALMTGAIGFSVLVGIIYGFILNNATAAGMTYQFSCQLQEAVTAAGSASAVPENVIKDVAERLAYGGMALYFVQWVIVLLMARSLQAMLYNPGRFGEEFRALQMPKMMSLIAFAATLLAVFAKDVPFTLAVISWLIVAMNMFFGLGLVHFFAQKRPYSLFFMTIFYAVFISYLPVMALILGIIATLDPWLDVRKVLRG